MTTLYINACIRPNSRTKLLADYLIEKKGVNVEEIKLEQTNLAPLNSALLSKRNQLIKEEKFSDPIFDLATKFAKADEIIIAAPMWDLSFPAILKIFFEHVTVNGISFKYSPKGDIISLVKAKSLYYVTTMGGYNGHDHGFGYVKALCDELYHIKDVFLITAEGLDIITNNVSSILEQAKKEIDLMVG